MEILYIHIQCNIIYIYTYISTDYRLWICRHIGMLFPPSSRTRKEQGKTRNEQGMNKERERNEQETTRKEQGMIKERTRNEQDRTRKEQERTRKEQGMNHGMFLFHDDFNGFFGQQTSQL